MEEIINRYLDSLKTLEVFVTGIEQILIEQTNESLKKRKEDLVPFFLAVEAEDQRKRDEIKYEESLKQLNDFNAESEVKVEERESGFRINFPDKEAATKFTSALDEIKLSIRQKPLLFESSLISLVTYFELLVSNLLHEHVTNFPETLGINKKELKYEELLKFSSIDDAREYILEKELQALMYNGLRSWMSFINSKIKVDTADLNYQIEEVNEILVRRNLFVHNGGVVNSIYLNTVQEEYTLGMEKGEKCIVDTEYMMSSMRLLELFGVTIGIKLWSKRRSEKESIVTFLHSLTYESMQAKKWELVKKLSDFILSFELSEADNLVAQMNKWLSIKRLGLFETIKESVEKKDLSAKEKHYRICRLILLDEHEKVYEELKDGLPEQLGKEEITDWPIFEDFRNSEFYQQLFTILEAELV